MGILSVLQNMEDSRVRNKAIKAQTTLARQSEERLSRTFDEGLEFSREQLSESTRQFDEGMEMREKELGVRRTSAQALSDLHEATARFQDAQTDEFIDKDLAEMRRTMIADKALMSKLQRDALTQKYNFLLNMHESDDAMDKRALRALYTSYDENKSMRGIVDLLGLQNDFQRTQISALVQQNAQSKAIGQSALQGLGFLLSGEGSKLFIGLHGKDEHLKQVGRLSGTLIGEEDLPMTEEIGGVKGWLNRQLGGTGRRLPKGSSSPANRSAEELEDVSTELQQQIENMGK